MKASVDELRQVVCGNGVEFPFTLDLRRGVALLKGPDRTWRVRPQRWSEKCRLARFAAWGEAFVRQQLWNMCVRPEPVEPVPGEQEALVALAAWLSAGGGHDALPLDSASLARVALTLCRELGVGPAALDALPAYEVESMWRQIPGATEEEPALSALSAGAEMFTHRIEVIPDARAVASPAPLHETVSEGNLDPLVSSSVSAARPSVVHEGQSSEGPAKPVITGAGRAGKTSPSISPMAAASPENSEEQFPGMVRELAPGGSSASQPVHNVQAGRDAALDLPHTATAPRAFHRTPEFITKKKSGRLAAKSRFRVMMPAAHEAARSSSASTAAPSITQHPAIAAFQNDSASIGSVVPWADQTRANRRLPMQAPFSPPLAAPASLSLSFDDFAAEFSEGLQVAATELGIFEER